MQRVSTLLCTRSTEQRPSIMYPLVLARCFCSDHIDLLLLACANHESLNHLAIL
jgi:hypothetical protein